MSHNENCRTESAPFPLPQNPFTTRVYPSLLLWFTDVTSQSLIQSPWQPLPENLLQLRLSPADVTHCCLFPGWAGMAESSRGQTFTSAA